MSEYPQTQALRPLKNRRWTPLVVCTLTAGLLGGATAAGALTLADSAIGAESSVTQQDSSLGAENTAQQTSSSSSSSTVTAAASAASPSVVTLGVSSDSGAGSGSGIILDDQGHVLTNTHVVTLGGASANADIVAQLHDGTSVSAEVIGTDPMSDLAIIKLDGAESLDLTPAELGSSSDLSVGDQAIAIGAPLGLSGTVTDGIISTLDRTITVASSAAEEPEADSPQGQDEEGYEFFPPFQDPEAQRQLPQQRSTGSTYLNVIQTDAAINQGNSGGALIDGQGRIIGINVAIASTGSSSEEAGSIGVGFAIPIDYAQRIAEDLIAEGEASHGLLGVIATDASSDSETNQAIVESFASDGQPSGATSAFTAGALITEVDSTSPAGEAGVEAGDIVTAVEGRRIDSSSALTAAVREYPSGQSIELTIDRDGQEQTIEVTLGEAG